MSLRNRTSRQINQSLLEIICPYRHTYHLGSTIGRGGSYNNDEVPYIESVLSYRRQGLSEEAAQLISAIEVFGEISEEYQVCDRMILSLKNELKKPMYELKLSIPLLVRLHLGDAHYIGDIIEKLDEELDEIPGVGRATIRKLREKVLIHFIPFQTDSPAKQEMLYQMKKS